MAAVGKLFWSLSFLKEKMWSRWIHSYYDRKANIWEVKTPSQATWPIYKILKSRDKLQHVVQSQFEGILICLLPINRVSVVWFSPL